VGATILVAFADLLPVGGVPLFPWLVVLALFVLARLDGAATARRMARFFLILLVPLLVSLFFVQGFFFPGATTALLEIGPLSLKQEGLLFGATILSRFAPMTAALLLFVLTTHPADLTHALTKAGLPYEIAYVILVALQLVPRMQAKAESITNAQRARGLRTEGSLLVRARALLPLIGPLITSALHETEERALALEARAFRAPGPRTSWRQLHDSAPQRLARWVLLLVGAALLFWGRFG
jgi:energy-coupling factor transport system permease protein